MLLADRAAAEDAVQQVFAALLRPAVRIEADDPLHYLRRAVRNECYSLLRRRRVRQGEEEAGPLLEAAAASRSPEERLALERSIRGLPSEQREVIHLHVFEGLTFREIANQTSESINTVASRYRYAIGRMRQQLDDLGSDKGRV
jgi:RNA polymerase sigma-70 factor (ECF subfamily)